MRLNLFTDSNLSIYSKSLFQFIDRGFFEKTQKVQLTAFSTIKAFSLSKPVDGILQRIWKIIPSISYAMYSVIGVLFPFYWNYWANSFEALNLLIQVNSSANEIEFTPKETELVSCFFKKIQVNSVLLHILRAFASEKQYEILGFIQGILSTTDSVCLEKKLEDILLQEINPLTVEEIGMIELSSKRQKFLECLKQQKVEGIDFFLTFWTKMVELQKHPVMITLREKTLSLFSEGCLGFLLSYEDDKKVRLNLKEDSLCFINLVSRIYYLLVGNSCHVGFAFSQKGNIFISDITPTYPSHKIRPHGAGILYPSQYLFRFTIKPLLSSDIQPKHAEFLQKFFSEQLTNLVSTQHDVSWGILEGVSAFFFGVKTPFWERKNVETMQSRELCTGFSAKLVLQALLKTKEKLQEFGYSQDKIQQPFQPREHIGRMLVADFIKHFKKKGLIEIVEDPFLTACIEPGFLKEELNLIFRVS